MENMTEAELELARPLDIGGRGVPEVRLTVRRWLRCLEELILENLSSPISGRDGQMYYMFFGAGDCKRLFIPVEVAKASKFWIRIDTREGRMELKRRIKDGEILSTQVMN